MRPDAVAAQSGREIAAVAVVGGGQLALLAATALARALPHCIITQIPAPVDPAALADTAHTTLPTLARLHRRIGLTERMLLDRADSSHRLATRYEGWRGDGTAFCVGYGAAADPALFRASAPGGDFAVSTAFACAGLFALPDDEATSPLSDLDYALRFDPAAHFAALTALARHLKIEIARGAVADVLRHADGTVLEITTTADERITADVFIDCSGPSRRLRSTVKGWIDWSDHVPIDRLVYPARAAQPVIAPIDSAAAFDGGYSLESPGRDATHRIVAWSSRVLAPAAAARVAAARLGDAAGPVIALRSGRLTEPWADNVVAFGDAAAAFDPIGWTNLHLAVVQIETFLDLLPRRADAACERTEFNRRTGLAADRVADYVAAHSVLRPWAAVFSASPTLARTVASFTRRGRLPAFEEESIARDLWGQLLTGTTSGVGPAAYAEGLAPDERAARIGDIHHRIAAAQKMGEPYPEALRRLLRETA